MSPETEKYKYFQRAIIESNPAAMKYRTKAEMQVHADTFALWVECLPWDTACFRGLGLKEILTMQGRTIDIPWRPGLALTELPWEPVLDDTILPEQPLHMFQLGKYYRVPYIIGTNRNESITFVKLLTDAIDFTYIDWVEYEAGLLVMFQEHYQQVLDLYPCSKGNCIDTVMRGTLGNRPRVLLCVGRTL